MRELSLHILDILQNSVEAGATWIELLLEEDLTNDILSITVKDNGRGMDEAQVTRATDPFFTTRTTRHVGLGLPLLAAATERCAGSFKISSAPGAGTTVVAEFQHSHIDRASLGNIADTLLALIMSESFSQACDLHYVHRVGDKKFEFDTAQIREELGEIPLTHRLVRDWLREFISEGEKTLYEPLRVQQADSPVREGNSGGNEDA